MREDCLETLDKMFPDGWICLYTCPNETFRMSMYNPHKYEIIGKFHDLIKAEADEDER